MRNEIDDQVRTQAMEDLRELRERLKVLERQGLEDSGEYDDLSEDYQTLALDILPLMSEEAYCTLYIYEHDYDKEVPFGDYDSYIVACDIGDEMIESDDITGYYVIVHDEDAEEE